MSTMIRFLSGGILHCIVFVFTLFSVISGVAVVFKKYARLMSFRRKARKSHKGDWHA